MTQPRVAQEPSPAPDLRILDATASSGLDLATDLFHRINRIIPSEQRVLTVHPTCLARDAITLMQSSGYSQLPVVDQGHVLGVFSFRSFAREAARVQLEDLQREKYAPGDLRVDEFLEKFEFARVTEEMDRVFHAMDRDNGVLIGAPERLIGILTPMDFLRYLYKVASPFVMVSEIELAVRALIRAVMTNEEIRAAATRCLSAGYGGDDKVPTSLEAMTFDNYQTLVAHGETWKRLQLVFGGTRNRAGAKLKQVSQIRNDLFHFKREITDADHGTLSHCREWLLTKVKQIKARPEVFR